MFYLLIDCFDCILEFVKVNHGKSTLAKEQRDALMVNDYLVECLMPHVL